MALKKLSHQAASELTSMLHGRRLALAEIDGRPILIQRIEQEEIDLDELLDGDKEAQSMMEEGVGQLEAGEVVSHEFVVRSLRSVR